MPKEGYKQTNEHKEKIGSVLRGRKIDPYIAKRKKLAWEQAHPEIIAQRKSDAESKKKKAISKARSKAGKKGQKSLVLRREGERLRIEALNEKFLKSSQEN